MGIRVAPGATDTINDYADGFVLHIVDADDVDAAAHALSLARGDIAALSATLPAADGEGPVLSSPVLAPNGPLLRVARLDVEERVLRTIPDLVASRLVEAGVKDAIIDAPEPGGALDALDSCANAVVLRIFPSPAGDQGTLPAAWIDIACEWVLGDLAPGDTVPMRLLAVEFEVSVADAPAIVHQASLARAWCDVVNGGLDERVRTGSITFGRTPHVALAAGGPACDTNALLARFDLLCEVARELGSDVAYACVDIEPTFEGIGLGLDGGGWRGKGGASPNLVAGELCDVLVPDVFPFQILGKGHLARLSTAGSDLEDPAIGEPLGDGQIEVLIGDPADWLPLFDARPDAQAEGFELLAPLLVTDERVDELLADRPGRQVADEHGGASDLPGAAAGMPNLDDIVLETLPHSRRGLRLTFLELVSWFAHEPHNDAPASVSPVVATYSRWFASALDNARRQELKQRARALIGTGRTPALGDGRARVPLSAADAERVALITDWLIRVQAASWLRLAGMVEAAGRLESIGPTRNHVDLVRAVDVLGSAIMIAGRRIDLTTSIAGNDRARDAELVDQAAWDAWERASEGAGWVAASEAASVGVPAELAYATDLRVIECARDPRVREELDESRRSIGDSAWAAALHAVAHDAWTLGWEAAHRAVDAAAVLSLRTALDRATRAATQRVGADDDTRELAIEAAEVAANESLTTAVLEAPAASGEREHPWDAARAAAAASEGGALWASIQELTQGAVDDGPWAAGMEAARRAVDDVLAGAPDLVARAVGAAVAREAAGTAARGVALRAAAVARAQGDDANAAAEAAYAALAPTAIELQDAAFALLDVLIAVGS